MGWFKREEKDPEFELKVLMAEMLLDDPKAFGAMLRKIKATVDAPVEWDQENQVWVVRTEGLDVGTDITLVNGRGGAEFEKAHVERDLGSGRYALSFGS